MDIAPLLLIGALGAAVGAYTCWRIIGSYYMNGPSAREKELWKRIAELEALLKVPPLFWHVWARYTDELTQPATRGKHAADNAAHERELPDDGPRPGDDRDQRP
jgi:hypothetical protein